MNTRQIIHAILNESKTQQRLSSVLWIHNAWVIHVITQSFIFVHIVRHCGLASCLGPSVRWTWYRNFVFIVGSTCIVIMVFGSRSRRRGRSVVLARWRHVPRARGRSVSIPSNRRTLFRWRRGNIAVTNNLLPVHVACPPRGLFPGPGHVVGLGRVVRPGRDASLKNKWVLR